MSHFAYIWPIALVIVTNIVYQICAKSVPQTLDPFASLTVSYTIAAIASAAMYLIFHRGVGLLHEIGKVNWASFVLGCAVVCMEVGYIYTYRVGWQVSKASTVQSAFLAVALLIVGVVLYREEISVTKIVGIVVCLIGLAIINQ